MPEISINKAYELYQIITDFTDPLEIFREAFQNAIDENADKVFCYVYEINKLSRSQLVVDIWNNGEGLKREDINCFFDLANSSKINESRVPIKGKLGYKGHGSKIFFNSEIVQICSKSKDDYWASELKNPIEQIEEFGIINYSEFLNPNELELSLPDNWEKGFLVRIIGHYHFKTEHTKFKLNHKNLRDYCKWYTVFGTINTLFDEELKDKNIKLYLAGLDIDSFEKEYNLSNSIDPEAIFEIVNNVKYEVIELGHYFPPERYKDTVMKTYANKIKSTKPYYEYYSRMFKQRVTCSNNTSFNFVMNIEGYQTKRRYDILLTRRGKSRTEITHTDSERYGLWACKGGVPVEKIDNWIEGGKGVYSFMQVFIDCDDFQLTANRSSIHNSDIEKLDMIKLEVNKIFDSKTIKEAILQRTEFERLESQLVSINEDGKNLKNRFREANKKKNIILPNGVILKEPTKRKTGYSESETFVLFLNLISQYPNLFNFDILDYDTNKGIDCVIDVQSFPKYMEIKGTMHKKINHPFRYIYKFVCYDIDFKENDIISDLEEFKTVLKINKSDKFLSFNDKFKDKKYTSYQLVPDSATIQSIEIINLKNFLTQVIGATIE